jgi:hypothetical protein
MVVAIDEGRDDLPRLLQRLEPMEVAALLLQRPHEALGVRMKRSMTPLHSGSPTYEGRS